MTRSHWFFLPPFVVRILNLEQVIWRKPDLFVSPPEICTGISRDLENKRAEELQVILQPFLFG